MRTNIGIAFIILSLFTTLFIANGQDVENEFQTRTSIGLSKEIIDDLTFEFSPELRWTDGISLDRYQLNAELEYKPIKHFYLSACYRFVAKDLKEDKEYLHRYQFNAIYKQKFKRWKPGIKVSYCNYTEDNDNGAFLRYKAFVSYNIKKCKFSPEAAYEIIHQLDGNCIYKYRYKLGTDYKINKKISLSAAYKFDFYMLEYKNRHIIDLGMKYKF